MFNFKKYNFILNKKELIKIEENSKEIWIITPDFYFDLQNEEIRNCVKENLKNNKKYVYFFPFSTENKKKLILMKKYYNQYLKNIKFVKLDKKFCEIFLNEIAIYNPKNNKEKFGIIADIGFERFEKNPKIKNFLDIKLSLKSLNFYIKFCKKLI
jgi:hypothetical protein